MAKQPEFTLERDIRDWVLVYSACVTLLLAVRFAPIRRALARRRQGAQAGTAAVRTEVDS